MVVLGVEEQGELVECDRVLTLRVLGHRESLEWNQDRRWLMGSPDGADGAVVAILVRMADVVNPEVDLRRRKSWSRL